MFGFGVFCSFVVFGQFDCMFREIKLVVSLGMVEISFFFGLGVKWELIVVFGYEFILCGIEVFLQDYGGQVVYCFWFYFLFYFLMIMISGVWYDGESGQFLVVRYKGEFDCDEVQGKEE